MRDHLFGRVFEMDGSGMGSEVELEPNLAFARAVALKEIEECTDLNQLKAVAKNLVKLHFAHKHMYVQLLTQRMGSGSGASIS